MIDLSAKESRSPTIMAKRSRQHTNFLEDQPVVVSGGGRRPATDRVLAVLELVAEAAGSLNVRVIGEALGLPKPTAHRLVNGLIEKGLLQRSFDPRAVTVGPKFARLAFDILRSSVAQAPARQLLQALSVELGETCNIGVMEGGDIVYLDRVEADHSPLRLQFGVGSRVPLHCTAMGKLFFSEMPEAACRFLLEEVPFPRFTPATFVDARALQTELDRVRRNGFAMDDEEYVLGVFCIAVPIRDAAGQMVAALAVQAPKARLSAAATHTVLPSLQRTAMAIAAVLMPTDEANSPAASTAAKTSRWSTK